MAYVPVPKDLSKIKTKLAFNLTKRQLVCFSSAAAVGLPAYLFSRGSIGNSAAMFLILPRENRSAGRPTAAAPEKQTSWRFVRLKASFVLILERSFGTGT